jgi:SAM-dependent methyltransferase
MRGLWQGYEEIKTGMKRWGCRRTLGVIVNVVVRSVEYWIWDLWHGVETRRFVSVSELEIEGLSNAQAAQEYACASGRLLVALKHLNLDWRCFSFVDLGCGKGKGLLLAARLPFANIIGVELAAKLVKVAKSNIGHYRLSRLRCKRIVVLAEDAAAFEFPEVPLVIYCYNSFSGAVMRLVLENLRRSMQQSPRLVFFILMNPVLASEFSGSGFWEVMVDGGDFRIYEPVPAEVTANV